MWLKIPTPLQGCGFYRITGKIVDEFGVYALEVSHMPKVGMKDRAAAKAGTVLEKDKSWQQGLIRRE
ncbi:MAG: hypothetical protein MUF12_07520 [Sediminibacterium sp.]|jgi:hypothetical protein|nr:hypothetical protein [Sediminibacterium sp.]